MIFKFRNLKRSLLFFLLLLFIFFIVSIPLVISRFNSLKQSISDSVETHLVAFSVNIDDQIAFVASDLLLMEDLIENRGILYNDNDSLQFLNEDNKQDLEEDLKDWIGVHPVYDQIRIIGLDGMEVLRVNSNQGDPVIVSEDDYQNKSDRYYFTNAITLDDDYIYLSKLDLNVENSQIEYIDGEPKEMLRIASTIYNDNDEKIGLIIINYYANNLFHDAETNISEFTSFFVTNTDGYFLHHQDKSIEFGFMHSDMQDVKFSTYYSYDDIIGAPEGGITEIRNDDRYLTYLVINNYKMEQAINDSIGREISVYSDNGDLYIFGEVQISKTLMYKNIQNTYILILVVYMLTTLVIVRLLDEVLFGRIQRVSMLEYSSNHDALTGLINRKKMFSTLEYLTSRNEDFIVLYLDLNKFKIVNDKYGHTTGDMMLIEVSKRLKNSVRETDIVSRIGGDEFLIALCGSIEENTIQKITSIIKKNVKEDLTINGVTHSIGVAIGISIQNGEKQLKELIHEADINMYDDKHD